MPPLSDELILGLLAKESSSRADNAAILEYFNEHPDLAERSAFCKHCYKQIYTYLFVDDHTVGFIRHDMYLELWEGNYLTKTAQVNLTWDAVAAKIADLIEQGRLIVPIKAAPVQQQMEQLTLTPEDSEKAGLPSHEQQAKNIDLAAEAKKWNKPIIDASGKYITEQDITDALCKGGGFEDSKFRIQQYLSAQVLPIEEDQARWLKKEYGIGGGTWFFRDGGHGFLDHMGKNLEITRRTEDGEYRRVLKWKEVAQRLRLLVYNDQYLTDAEKATYQAWAAEQQAARAANDAALAHAKHAIADFCENEGLNEPNFSDLTRVEFAYSTTEDDEHEIQVYANLLRNEIRYEVDGNIVHIDYFHDNHELAAQGIENSAFSDFINTAEAEFEKHHPTTRNALLPDNYFDCVIGNVPFGNFQVNDPQYNRLHFPIHDYFFAKSIDKLRTGGIMAFITSSGTLDKKDDRARKYIAERCDLIGAVRLPNNAFKGSGTKIMTDVIFLQKRDTLRQQDEPWLHLAEDANGITMNHYFVEHPEMICGKMEIVAGPYGPTSTCQPIDPDAVDRFGKPLLETQIDTAMQHLTATLTKAEISVQEESGEDTKYIDADPFVRNFSYTVKDDKIYYREGAVMRECNPNAASAERIRKLVELRDTTRTLIDAQLQDLSDEEIHRLQGQLNRQYDAFRAKHGLINSRSAELSFRDDSSYYLLCSLENVDEKGNFISKSDMFTKRTIRSAQIPDHADTASDALALSIGERAKVDMPYMMHLTGKDEATLAKELAGVIFVEPFRKQEDGSPVYLMADEYLSGNVREKLRVAHVAADQDPAFRINVEALEQVQPKDLTAGEITVRLGVTWIGSEIIKRFADELFQSTYREQKIAVRYNEYLNNWYISNKSQGNDNIRVTNTYGTKRINGYHLLENALNLRATKIYDTIYDENGKEQHKLNGPATEEAQAKQRMIEDAFKDWIFKDRERRESLVALYNEKFNCIRPREYDGSHIQFFGMNPEIALRPHQRNAIAHILYGHNTLLAHVVGAGKTYEMVAAAMEKKRLGLCSKTLVAVPNHLTGQFASEALKLYPNANILVTTQRDFEKSNRKRFCAKIATGNYDIVVIGHSQFEKIPLSDARKAEFIRKQIDELEMQLESMDNSDSRLTVKQLESKKKQLKTKLSNLLDAPKRDDVVTFEELGADSLMVDEAHNFKNLMTVTKMHNIAGISTTESQKASDLFMKCQYLDEITGARGVTFATGTPISNSMTELYTMQRYLQQYTLERNGLANFDSWAATFGETVTAIELAPEGTGYRTKTRFARFFNLPELMAMFKECADIQTADMLKLPVPALVGGKPTNIQLKPSEIQKQMVAELGERADKIRNKMVKPYEDNMLKITNDGRKLALDQRLIDPDLPDDPDSKVNICVGKIFEIWEHTMPQRSAQLVFCDLSTPKAGVFNVYDDMKAKLIERGIPETEIAFIHEANTDARKTELFGKVRSGAVRVLMGSTAKMGAGTNVQKRLIALHHLDVPWRPSDIEQREGRILRQGNENKEVYVFRYVTEGTFDAYSWQLIENKQKFIGQIMTSKSPARSCNDMDEAALSYAEVKALAAGNPLIKEKMDLDVQLTRLKTLKAAHDSQRYELENKIAIGFPAEIRKCKEQIENATVDAATVKEHSVVDADGKDVFCIQLEKKVYYEKEPAGKALLGLLGLALNSEKPVPIGHFKGMELQIQHLPFGNEYHARLAGSGTYSTQLGADVLGNLTRLSNLANGIEPSIEKTRNMQIQLEQQLASAEEEVKRPFPQATELTEKSKRLAVLEGLLNMNDKDIVTDTEPEQQCQIDNRQRGQEER